MSCSGNKVIWLEWGKERALCSWPGNLECSPCFSELVGWERGSDFDSSTMDPCLAYGIFIGFLNRCSFICHFLLGPFLEALSVVLKIILISFTFSDQVFFFYILVHRFFPLSPLFFHWAHSLSFLFQLLYFSFLKFRFIFDIIYFFPETLYFYIYSSILINVLWNILLLQMIETIFRSF